MKASTFLKMFDWCGATVRVKPAVVIEAGDEEFELILAPKGHVKWRLVKPGEKIPEAQIVPQKA